MVAASANQVVVSEALTSLVNKINGRRRTRTLPAKWLAESAASLAPGEREFFHGGTSPTHTLILQSRPLPSSGVTSTARPMPGSIPPTQSGVARIWPP